MCFEARSNTSCRNIHETEFELAFDLADEVLLGSVFRSERYSESERIDFPGMASRLGSKARHFATNQQLLLDLESRLTDLHNAIVVFFSNGSFDGVPQKFSELCRARCVPGKDAP